MKIQATEIFEKNRTAKTRFVVNQGGARSSKTYSLCQLFAYKLLTERNKIITICRKSFPSLRFSVMRDFFEVLNTFGIYDERNHNKTENVYKYNSNIVEFMSLDDPQKKRGSKRNYLWLNEANEADYESFKQLNMRTTDQTFLDYNPSFNKHWIIDYIINGNDCTFIKSTYKDNPFLEQSIIDQIENLKNYDVNDYKIYALGELAEASGLLFRSIYYSEYEYMPSDVRGVIYCDPNLAKKSMGDSTSIIKLLYSASTGYYYVADSITRSFNDSNELLNEIIRMRSDSKVKLIGFDGNVSQESQWSQHIENYSRIKGVPFPVVDYKRYRVDDLAKNAQWIWNDSLIKFPRGFSQTANGKEFLFQLYNFQGKKNSLTKDDAPDALICAIEYLFESGFTIKLTDNFKNIIKGWS